MVFGCMGDVVQIDSWFAGVSEKNGIANHWFLFDANTGETLAQSNIKVSKFPEEVNGEMTPITMDYCISDDIKLSKLHNNIADFVQTGLTVIQNMHARWSDLNINHRVNFAKYIGWIQATIYIMFRRECGENNEIKSLTTIVETRDNAKYQSVISV
ncbi:hypothetical protein MKW94_028573, partial [Papaver nudicaule]|nr:hypothetical protein [Papaver nudicaule]